MKSFLSYSLCVLCVLCVRCYSLDRNAFVFTHYDLEVRVDPAGHAIAAKGKVTLRNVSRQPQKDVSLQISSSLQWRLIELGGKPLQYLADAYTSDIDHTGGLNEAIVTLPQAVAPQQTVEIDVGYDGTITRDATRLTRIGVPAAQAGHSDWDEISEPITVVRGAGYVTWYPVAMNAANLSESSLFPTLAAWKDAQRGSSMKLNLCWVTDEEQLSVVSNGRVTGVNRQNLGATDEATTHAGCSQIEYANLADVVPTFAIADYQNLARPQVDVFHLADHASGAQEYALDAEKVQPALAAWFGPQQRKVQLVQLPDDQDAPFESGAVLFTPLVRGDREAIELRMAHQVAHAAFHSPRLWIDEGLAHFAQALEREQQAGRPAAVAYLDGFLPALAAAEKALTPETASSRSLINTDDELLYRAKAAFVWWMMREMLGDDILKKAIRDYRPALDTSTAYMPHLIQQQSKRDLDWFFEQWVYRDRGLPDFRVTAAYPRPMLAGSFVVTVTVENTGDAGAEVPVRVLAPEGERQTRIVVPAKGKEVARIEIGGTPTEAIVNDGSVPESDTANNRATIAMPTKPQ